MRNSAFAPALAALLVSAAPLAMLPIAPARAQVQKYGTNWSTAGGTAFAIRLVKVTIRDTAAGPRAVAEISVGNNTNIPQPRWKVAGLALGNAARTNFVQLSALDPVTLARLPTDQAMPAPGVMNFAAILPDSEPTHPIVVLSLAQPNMPNTEVGAWPLAELRAGAVRELSAANLDAFATRYRTSTGSMLTLNRLASDVLEGQSQTVGVAPRFAESLHLTPDGADRFVGQLYLYSGSQKALAGDISFQAKSNSPFRGHLNDASGVGIPFVGCPVADSEPNNWTDPKLRTVSTAWARLNRVVARRTDAGTRLDVEVALWSVADTQAEPRLVAVAGSRRIALSGSAAFGSAERGPAGSGKLAPCETRTMTYSVDADLSGANKLALDSGAGETSAPWDIADAIAAAGPAPTPPPAPAPATPTSPPAGPYQTSAEDRELLAQMSGVWIASTAVRFDTRDFDRSQFSMIGSPPNANSVQEQVSAPLVGPARAKGSHLRYNGGDLVARGALDLQLAPERVSGTLTDEGGALRPFVACKATAYTHDSRFGGNWYWIRYLSVKRDGGRRGLDVVIEVRSVAELARTLDLGSAQLVFRGRNGETAYSSAFRLENGQAAGSRRLNSCQAETYAVRFTDVPFETLSLSLTAPGGQASWDVGVDAPEAGSEPSSEVTPAPAPPSSPPPGPPSRDQGPEAPAPSSGTVPPATRAYSNYGIWDFRIESLAPGEDGDWQAVIRVRDAATWRVGLGGGGVMLTLFDEDGRSVGSDPVNFRAAIAGTRAQLEVIPQTMWMEKGDEIRIRLLVPHSRGFKPVRLRLGSGDRQTLTRTFPMR